MRALWCRIAGHYWLVTRDDDRRPVVRCRRCKAVFDL